MNAISIQQFRWTNPEPIRARHSSSGPDRGGVRQRQVVPDAGIRGALAPRRKSLAHVLRQRTPVEPLL